MRQPSTGRGIPGVVDNFTLAAWHLDETGAAITAIDQKLNARPLAQVGAIPVPARLTGRCGRASQHIANSILGRAGDAQALAMWQQPWTVQCLVQLQTPNNIVGGASVFGYRGATDSALAVDNDQFSFRVVPYADLVGGVRVMTGIEVRWENGAGVAVTSLVPIGFPNTIAFPGVTAGFRFTLGQWTLLTFVARQVTPTVTLEVHINGKLAQTFTGLAPPTGGTTAAWRLGGATTAANALSQPFNGWIDHVSVSTTARSQAFIANDFRRISGQAFPTKLTNRFFLSDQSATLRDITDPSVAGSDFVDELVIDDDIDAAVETLSVTLGREDGAVSLAPSKGDSFLNNPNLSALFAPYLDLWRVVRLDIARTPLWIEPVALDFFERFRGRIVEYDDGGEKISLTCRDQGERLMRRWIDQDRVYPNALDASADGILSPLAGMSPPLFASSRDQMLRRILSDNGSLASLFVPELSGSGVAEKRSVDAGGLTEGALPRGQLLPTMRAVAAMIGWDISFKRWDALTNQFRLTFFDPQRERTDADCVIDPVEVESTRQGRVAIDRVRNLFEGTYPDALTQQTTDAQNRLPASVVVSNLDPVVGGILGQSQTAYDVIKMETIEDGASQIDTSTEMLRMLRAQAFDLAFPYKDSSKEVACLPELTSLDTILFLPDGLHETASYTGAVRTLRHTFTRDKMSTTINAQGRPAIGYRRWPTIEAGRAGKPPIRNAAEAISSRGMLRNYAEIVNLGERTRFSIGNSKFPEVKNGDFSRWTKGQAFAPDGWTSTSWGTDQVYGAGISGMTGFGVVAFTGVGSLTSKLISLEGLSGTPYTVSLRWQRQVGVGAPTATIQFFDEAQNLAAPLATQALTPGGAVLANGARNFESAAALALNTWTTSICEGLPSPVASTAKYMRIVLTAPTGVIVDACNVARKARMASTWSTVSGPKGVTTGTGVALTLSNAAVGRRLGITQVTGVYPGNGDHYLIGESGTYQITVHERVTQSAGTAAACRVVIRANETFTAAPFTSNNVGTVLHQGAWNPAPISGATGQIDVSTVATIYLTQGIRVSIVIECASVGAPSLSIGGAATNGPPALGVDPNRGVFIKQILAD